MVGRGGAASTREWYHQGAPGQLAKERARGCDRGDAGDEGGETQRCEAGISGGGDSLVDSTIKYTPFVRNY